jgi:endonuclease/exonuclease/phosphatase family metal-dependent hydrolase
MTIRIISWNIAQREDAWRALLDSDADIALLQEATEPPVDVMRRIDVNPGPWCTAGSGARPWRTAIVKLSSKVHLEWIESQPIENTREGDFAVSRLGTLAAAIVKSENTKPFIIISMYGAWEAPHPSAKSSWIYADGSVHRLISDLSAFIGQQAKHRILAAGDLNILHGYGETLYWAGRYKTIFSRMETLGLKFIGPQAPAGRIATPWPDELPASSKNVPTYHTNRQSPLTATRQLDFVFSSTALAARLNVRALNDPDLWGSSDHCRVGIEIS